MVQADIKNIYKKVDHPKQWPNKASIFDFSPSVKQALGANDIQAQSFVPNVSVGPPPGPVSDFKQKKFCSQCDSSFSLFLCKYHCKNCGAPLCDTCSSRIALPHFRVHTLERVCHLCERKLRHDLPTLFIQNALEAEDLGLIQLAHDVFSTKFCDDIPLLSSDDWKVLAQTANCHLEAELLLFSFLAPSIQYI